MRVLHVSQATTYGLGRYLADLITDQAARGWDVSLATPPDDRLESICKDLGVTHRPWAARRSPGPSTFFEIVALHRIVYDVEPEVVQLHSSKAGLAGRLALRGRRPTVFTPHAWSFFHEGALTRWLARWWERRATRWTDVILCVSHGEQVAGEQAGIHGRFEVVTNAVDLVVFCPADAAERAMRRVAAGIPANRPVAVCVGRLVEQKGQDVLVRAWTSVRAAVPDAELFLVGDGPQRGELDALSGPGVRLVGEQADARSWLVLADVVVQPSRWEGLSLVALEALACGSSIVTTDVPGMREVIGDSLDAAGAIVPVDDLDALAAAITVRLLDPELTQRERVRARARASHYSIENWGTRIAHVLEAARRP